MGGFERHAGFGEFGKAERGLDDALRGKRAAEREVVRRGGGAGFTGLGDGAGRKDARKDRFPLLAHGGEVWHDDGQALRGIFAEALTGPFGGGTHLFLRTGKGVERRFGGRGGRFVVGDSRARGGECGQERRLRGRAVEHSREVDRRWGSDLSFCDRRGEGIGELRARLNAGVAAKAVEVASPLAKYGGVFGEVPGGVAHGQLPFGDGGPGGGGLFSGLLEVENRRGLWRGFDDLAPEQRFLTRTEPDDCGISGRKGVVGGQAVEPDREGKHLRRGPPSAATRLLRLRVCLVQEAGEARGAGKADGALFESVDECRRWRHVAMIQPAATMVRKNRAPRGIAVISSSVPSKTMLQKPL